MFQRSIGLAAAGLLSLAAPAATTVSINASVQGLFTSFGQNNKGYNAGPGNILCGRNNVAVFRNYFVFNLPPNLVPAGQQVLAAELVGKLGFRGYQSTDPTETWTLFDVAPANYPVLVNESVSVSNRVDVFNDLGTGNAYGARVVSAANEPPPNTGPGLLTVSLSAPSFFTDLTARRGAGSIAIGGSMTTLVGTSLQLIFAFSGYEPADSGPATLNLTIGRPPCPWDLNNDGQVDDDDFVLFAQAYDLLDCNDPNMPPDCPADFNQDGMVEDQDFVEFAQAYDALLCP